MPKRKGYLYGRMLDEAFIREVILKACKHRHDRSDVARVMRSIDLVVEKVKYVLEHDDEYEPSPYHERLRFDESSQKYRTIRTVPFNPDCIIQWLIVEQLKSVFMKSMDYWCSASIPGRGGSHVYRGIKRFIKHHPKSARYGAQADVRHYYDTINIDKLMQLLVEIKQFNEEHQFNMGALDLFSQDSRMEVNEKAVKYLYSFSRQLRDNPSRKSLVLSDTFNLQFRVKENDNDTGWTEKIANVGSDGTDILVKAMVNIMLINVFKEKASRKFGDFRIHCMMDEIGKLHPNNVKGILAFANCRNIVLVNSSPTTYNVEDYRYTYLLSKDAQSFTQVVPLLTRKQ